MEICRHTQAIERNNADTCTIWEFPMDVEALNFALSEINGRYPETGLAVNTVVSELIYVLSGSGQICVDDKVTELAEGDALLIKPGEKFYWQGQLRLVIACTPKFTPEQHLLIQTEA